jgi:hypothetical protein
MLMVLNLQTDVHKDDQEALGKIGPWMARGAQFFQDEDHERLHNLIFEVTEHMRPFWNPARQDDVAETRQALCDRSQARQDAYEFKGNTEPRTPPDMGGDQEPISINPDFWDIVNEDDLQSKQPSRVLFVIAPCLVKYGTADGRDYRQRRILAKGKLVCK